MSQASSQAAAGDQQINIGDTISGGQNTNAVLIALALAGAAVFLVWFLTRKK